ncbi:hypothetical protein GCM10027034_42620 [Ramlibacter solisilvae]|uniref:Uncharacterized protein n=1 Tax=Ramlibacter tataouinensis TaxID=94132 RepID=A0A127JTG3_9BURK|nr:hypothetical protein [Ramlibacter tataouinensis]AMO23256.1 hypothetical protein UC35_10565 [Ramlibacter tataouinensis]
MAQPAARKVAPLSPDEQRHGKHLKTQPAELDLPPSTGRNTKLGRKVEKPDDPKPGGPSGQKVETRDRKHANK